MLIRRVKASDGHVLVIVEASACVLLKVWLIAALQVEQKIRSLRNRTFAELLSLVAPIAVQSAFMRSVCITQTAFVGTTVRSFPHICSCASQNLNTTAFYFTGHSAHRLVNGY